jgi:predicted ATPase/DNA-binding CsgD family transcriptional regulator
MEQNNVRVLPPRTCVVADTAPVSQLPTPLTSFVGREQEVTTLCHLLQERRVRLLTLSGPGGVGKTRLALAVAKQLLPCFAEGIFFVPFASIRDPLLVLPHIASTLGIAEESRRSPGEQLKARLRHSSLLLLLDNFEQLVAAAPLLIELLQACPGLSILVTSRALLRVQGEQVFEVLPFPPPQHTQADPFEQLRHDPAVQLFVQRAQALKADFELSRANSALIAEICRRLDGLPLAIELAAARSNLLPPQTLLKRLERRLPLLRSSGQDVDWRQQTVSNTLQWSYDLLSPREQGLFRALAVFTGGATLEAVEAVYEASRDGAQTLLDGIGSLIDKSLLLRSEQTDGELRLVMLETVREYAGECLQANGEAARLHQNHAAYFLALAEEAEPKLAGAEQLAWLERLEQEQENLRAALNWLIESGKRELALRLGSALWPFWSMHNHMHEGYRWLEKALVSSEVSPSLRAKTLYAAANFSFFQGDYNRAAALCEESLELFRELGDKRSIALVLNGLSHVALVEHRYDVVRRLSEENLLLARELGDRWKTAEALFLSVYGYLAQGEYSTARAAAEENLAWHRELGEPRALAHATYAVGRVAYKQNDLEAAYSLYKESLALARDIDEQWLITACLVGLGEVVAAQGKHAWAARLWGAEEALHKTIRARCLYVVRLPDEEAVAATRARLGEEAFAAAWAQGRTMTVEQVLAARQGELVPEPPQLVSQRDASLAPSSRCASTLRPEAASGLTPREVDVLRLIAEGLTNTQIAEHLVISPVTVNTHIRSIYSKLGISSRSAATRYVLEHGLT